MSKYEVKGAPFRYKGAVDVRDCKSAEEVIEKASLNWEVAKCELYAVMPNFKSPDPNIPNQTFISPDGSINTLQLCKGAYATYRTDCNIPLGVVKDKYTIVQNKDAFKFFNDAVYRGQARFDTAGFFGNGERIFISAKLPNTILVGDTDPVENYLVFTTSHDGSHGVKILFTPIRVICQNTLNAAIKQAQEKAASEENTQRKRYFSFKHTISVFDKINSTAELLASCDVTAKTLKGIYTAMYRLFVKQEDVNKIIGDIIFSHNEKELLKLSGYTYTDLINRNFQAIDKSTVSSQKLNDYIGTIDYYHSGIGQDNILGTIWGIYNAISGYYSNVKKGEGTTRMNSLLYSTYGRKIEEAGNYIASNYL